MKRILVVIFVLCLFAQISVVNAFENAKLNHLPFRLGSVPKFYENKDGSVYYSYYASDADGSLVISRFGQQTPAIIKETGGSVHELNFLEDDVFLTWRAKKATGEKYVLLQISNDKGMSFGKPITLNTGTDALAILSTADNGKDRFYVAWVDERISKKHEKSYGIYLNYTLDKGKTFLEQDILISDNVSSATNPQIIVDGDKVHVFYMGVEKIGDNYLIYHRVSLDKGKTWQEAKKLYEIIDWSPYTLKATQTRKGILLFWGGVKGLHALYSENTKEWAKIDFKAVADNDVNRFDVVIRGKEVFMVASWDVKPNKQNAYFFKSVDGGRTWSEPKRLNKNRFNNTRAWFPDFSVSKDGKTVVTAWQDHRDIRGRIYISYSLDGGKTWLQDDIMIGSRFTNEAFPYVRFSKDGVCIIWFRFHDDSVRDNVDLFYLKATVAEIKELKPYKMVMSDKDKETLLQKRVMGVWKTQTERNRSEMFDFYDPFFRSRVTRDWFAGQSMAAHYTNPEIVSVDIEGNVAKVRVKVTYEIKGLFISGKTHHEPPKETITNETWLYIEDNWYREYIDYSTDSTIAVY